jgi:hypothetical protein
MNSKVTERLPADLRQAARIMAETGTFETGQAIMSDAADEIERLRDALKEAGDVIECYHKSTGVDLGDVSGMPFYEDTMLKIDTALKEGQGNAG